MRARGNARAGLFAVVLGAVLGGTAACSALLDWSDLTGGARNDGAPMADGAVLHDAGPAADAAIGDEPGNDGMITACTGGLCAPVAPSGWLGPVWLYAGAAPAPSCGVTVFDGHGGLTAAAATCSPCSCDAPTGTSCSNPVLSFYVDPTCTKADPTTPSMTVSTTCASTAIGAIGAILAAPMPGGGSCATTGGAATNPPFSWDMAVRACPVATSGDCAGGSLCVPTLPPSMSACIMQSGTVTDCPSAYPRGPRVYSTGVDDSRGCSACACSTPMGATCGIGTPAIDLYADPVCATTPTTLMAPSACTTLTGTGSGVKLASVPTLVDAGRCSVTAGGEPTGAATPSGNTSFCCLP